MIRGIVVNRHLMLSLILRLSGHPDLQIDFVVDTGFTDFLTLPPAVVALLQLPFLYDLPINLANGANDIVAVHEFKIVWHGIERSVRVFATGSRPLLGTALLDGDELVARFVDGSAFTVNI